MKNNYCNSFNKTVLKRWTVVFVAAIFLCGTAFIPSGVYAAEETVPANEVVEEQALEQTEVSKPIDEQTTTPQTTEPQNEENKASTVDNIAVEDLLKKPESEDVEYNGYIFKLENDAPKDEISEIDNQIEELDGNHEAKKITSDEVYVADSLETIETVAKPATIEYIEPNYKVSLSEDPNDTDYKRYSWSLKMMNVPKVWDRNLFGSGTTIAVLDTGVPNHEDIDSSNFVDQKNVTTSNNDMDNIGHATKAIGVIAASYNNGKGFTGIMPQAKIMPVKVFPDDTEGWVSDIVAGIEYATDKKADVINMSLACGDAQSLKDACEKAAAKGILIVAAAGNDGNKVAENESNSLEYPASYDCVVSVASVDCNGKHSYFSTHNNKVTVASPGQSVRVPTINGNSGSSLSSSYTFASGTSFSSPGVAALAAMVKSIKPETNATEFMDILKYTSIDTGDSGYDPLYGYGIVDFENAYIYCTEGISALDNASSLNNASFIEKESAPAKVEPLNVYLSSSAYTYNGGVKTPSVTVVRGNNILTEGKDYSVSFSGGRVNIGTYAVRVSATSHLSTGTTYNSEKTAYFRINPPLVKGIKSPSRGKKRLNVRWSSMSKKQKKSYKYLITGYQVRASLDTSFAAAKYGSVRGYKKTSKTIKGLAKKRTYYVQYRSFKTIGSETYYSNWSAIKAKKTR